MARFSIDKNMVAPTQQSNSNGQLIMPSTFDKYVVALDRDGVLCECDDAITGPEKFVSIPDSMRAVAIIRSKGHKITVLFDQPGVVQKK